MSWKQRTFEEIRDDILTDIRNEFPDADLSKGSDLYIWACIKASASWGIEQHINWVARQIFADTSDSAELEHHASTSGLTRKAASKGSGTATLTGTNDTVVEEGLILETADNILVITTSGGTIAAGVLDVTAEAIEGGIDGNIPDAASLTVQDPPAGVDSNATASGDFTGGSDIESDPDFLARYLDFIRRPPAGGNAHDYWTWAMSVAGVSSVFVFPIRQGLGTVTLIICTSGDGAERIPGQALLDAVIAYIEPLRPVTAKDWFCFAPTDRPEDITGEIKVKPGYVFADVRAWVITALNAYLNRMAPGETLYKSQLEAVISGVEGVLDRSISLPAANVVPINSGVTMEMISPGDITITEMA